jgi:hypothetical protein
MGRILPLFSTRRLCSDRAQSALYGIIRAQGIAHPARRKVPTNDATLMTPLTKEHQVYADLMDEARLRIHAMRDAIAAKESWAPRLLQEFAYLQLRMLCEVIAGGCLLVHGAVKHRDVLKSWRAPDIIEKLGQLNSDFYPRGVRFRKTPTGLHLDDYSVPQLSKLELVELWERSGAFLHRGSAKNLVAEHGKMLNVNLDTIILNGQKILNLLEQHIISSADKKTHLIVALSSEDAGGRAAVGVAASP